MIKPTMKWGEPPLRKSHLKLVEKTKKSKSESNFKEQNLSKKQKRRAALALYAITCRSFVNGYVSAAKSISQTLPNVWYLVGRVVDPQGLSAEVRSQIEVVVILHRDVSEAMQSVVDFRGGFAERFAFMKRQSAHICGAARTLKAVDQYFNEAVHKCDLASAQSKEAAAQNDRTE